MWCLHASLDTGRAVPRPRQVHRDAQCPRQVGPDERTRQAHLFALARSGAAQLRLRRPSSQSAANPNRVFPGTPSGPLSMRGRSSMRSRVAGLLSVVIMTGLVTVTAAAQERSGPDIFTMHSLVSDDASTAAAGEGRIARQRLGPQRRPDDAVVDVEQRHEHLDALQRRRREAGADGRRSPGGADRHGLQRQRRGLRRQPERQAGAARFLFATEAGTISAGRRP